MTVPRDAGSSRWRGGSREPRDDGVVVTCVDRVLRVSLNRVLALNAIDAAMARRLNFVWCSVRDDPEVDAIVLSGAGAEAFSVGFDRADRPSVPVTPRECGVDKRLVVAVNGVACREALQLVEQADVVVASAHARFLAAAPDLVGPRLTTRGSTGTAPAPITAEHALRSGLADDVVPLASLHRRAAELATSLDHPHTQHRRRNLT